MTTVSGVVSSERPSHDDSWHAGSILDVSWMFPRGADWLALWDRASVQVIEIRVPPPRCRATNPAGIAIDLSDSRNLVAA